MKKKERSVYECIYDMFFHDKEHRFKCFYCGEPGDTVDHVPPISRVNDYRKYDLTHEVYVKVVACHECNELLANSLQENIMDRVECLKALLEEKYNRLINGKQWNTQMIRDAELKGWLRKKVESWESAQKWISRRIDYYHGVNAFLMERRLAITESTQLTSQ